MATTNTWTPIQAIPATATYTPIGIATAAGSAPISAKTAAGAQSQAQTAAVQTAQAQTGNAVTAAGAKAATVAAQQALADAKTRTLQNEELTSFNVNKIMGEDSQLLQRARSKAADIANGRGLLNSSMAAGAGTAAMLDAATPIAQADAGAYISVNDKNLANQQQTSIFNAQQTQQNNQFNAGEANTTSRFNANLEQTNNQFNAGEKNAMTRFNVGEVNNMSQFNTGQVNSMAQFNTGQVNQTARDNANLAQNNNQFNAGQVNSTNQFNASQTQQNNQFNASATNNVNQYNSTLEANTNQFNASQSNQILATMMDQQNKIQLANIEAQYKTVMQTQASASSIYQGYTKEVSNVLMNPDLTADAKAASITTLNSTLKTGMDLTAAMGNMPELSTLLNFAPVSVSSVTGTGTGTTGTGKTSGLTISATDVAQNNNILADYAGITNKADVKSMTKLTIAQQQAIDAAIATGTKAAMTNAIAGTPLTTAAKNKLRALVK